MFIVSYTNQPKYILDSCKSTDNTTNLYFNHSYPIRLLPLHYLLLNYRIDYTLNGSTYTGNNVTGSNYKGRIHEPYWYCSQTHLLYRSGKHTVEIPLQTLSTPTSYSYKPNRQRH